MEFDTYAASRNMHGLKDRHQQHGSAMQSKHANCGRRLPLAADV